MILAEVCAEAAVPYWSCISGSVLADHECLISPELKRHRQKCVESASSQANVCKLRGARSQSCEVEKRAHHGLCASASDNWEYKQTNANLGETRRNSNVAAAQIATIIAIEVTQSSSQTATTCAGALQPQTPMVFNWTQCSSEGGAGNCAICNGQGGHLPCDQVPSGASSDSSECPDNEIWKTSKFFTQNGISAEGQCHTLPAWGQSEITVTTYEFPQMKGNLVVTKAQVAHPNKASKNVGVFMFKRAVSHLCTGNGKAVEEGGCKKDSEVTDVAKVGYCIRCPEEIYGNEISASATVDEHTKFMAECFPHAFEWNGTIKHTHECTGCDFLYAKAAIAVF